MKMHFKAILLAGFSLAALNLATAADDSVAGKWKTTFDSQIGTQKYTFEFKVEDGKLTGKATGERDMGTNTVDITEGKIKGDEISFVEPLKLQDQEIRIEYSGKVNGDEIKLHRKVGDLAEYDIVAKRVKAGETKSDSATTNSPAAKQ